MMLKYINLYNWIHPFTLESQQSRTEFPVIRLGEVKVQFLLEKLVPEVGISRICKFQAAECF
jgi:hypothetical protein